MGYERIVRYSVRDARPQPEMGRVPFHCYTFEDGYVWTEFFRTNTGFLLRFPDLADFEVAAGGESVVAIPGAATDDVTVEHLYISQVVPLALSQQGRPTFHASVVTVQEGAVAFLGKTGLGKSTLAASFALQGSTFLTDDALLIDDDGIRAMPSHASVRLWQDSVEALIPVEVAKAGAISYSDKARLLAGDALRYTDEPATLLAAFVLRSEQPGGVVIEPLTGSERQMAWIENSFLLDIEDRELLARHFDWTHRVAEQVPTFSLDYPRDYGMLGVVREAILEHVATLP